MRGVSLTHPVLALFSFGEFLLHIPWFLYLLLGVSLTRPMLAFICLFSNRGRFSYTSRVGVFLTHPTLASIFVWGVSLTHPVLLDFYAGSFSYTSRAGFVFCFLFFSVEFVLHIPCCCCCCCFCCCFLLLLFLSGEFLLHIPCRFNFYVGSFSYTSRASFNFCLGCFSYTTRASFIFMLGVSLTHPVLASFLFWQFLLHIP